MLVLSYLYFLVSIEYDYRYSLSLDIFTHVRNNMSHNL